MTRAASFDPADRLPWLSDPAPAPVAPAPKRSLIAFVVVAGLAAVAGATGWSALEPALQREAPPPAVAERTVQLAPPVAAPQAAALERKPSAPVSDVEALRLPAEPPVRAAAPAAPPKIKAERRAARARAGPAQGVRPAAGPKADAAPVSKPTYESRAWNSGIAGRIIQLGAFRTPAQADSQWNRVYYRYPLLRPLPPRVVKAAIRGRTYYRLQLGTFSHAHSELLCQRLRAIGEGCIVLGLKRQGRG